MDDNDERKTGDQLRDELDLWEGLVKSPGWKLLYELLTNRRTAHAIAIRQPATGQRSVLKAEWAKGALQEVEFVMTIGQQMVQQLQDELTLRTESEESHEHQNE